jgi:hypothetical protein
MHETQAVRPNGLSRRQIELLAIQLGLCAEIGTMKSCEHLDQRGLTGPVWPHKGVNLAWDNIQRHVVEGAGTAERLRDVP